MRILKFVWYLGLGGIVESLVFLPLCIIGLIILAPVVWTMQAWERANA
jgi:uncharacterized membrane protein YccF (DUF307 family)